MTEFKFDIGSIVCLKSGGPTMTMCFQNMLPSQNRNSYNCIWFNGGELLENTVYEETIKKA